MESMKPINPNAVKRFSDPTNAQEEVRVHQALQRKLSLTDDAQVLVEQTVGTRKHRLRRSMYLVLILFAIGSCVVLAIQFLVLPRLVRVLPELIVSPYTALPSYKRIMSGYVDYYPPTQTQGDAGISAFGHGASFSVLSSADVVPGKGVEGVVRFDIEKTVATDGASDIDIGYKVLFSEKPDDVGIYFFFNQWPDFLQELGITGDSRGVWFGHDATSEKGAPEDVQRLVNFLNPETQNQTTKRFISYLWDRALRSGALRWKLENMYRTDEQGRRVADLLIVLDTDAFAATLASVASDPLFTEELQAIAKTPIGEITVMDALGSLRSFNGFMTIGIHDRMVHEATWTFDVNDKRAGTYRGSLTVSLAPLPAQKDIIRPQEFQSALDIVTLMTVDVPPVDVATTSADADGDGLDAASEEQWGTDPLRSDTDGDGYSDGAEVTAGYNPIGTGKLESR